MQGGPPLRRRRRRRRRPLAGDSPEPGTARDGAARPRQEYGFGLPAAGGPPGEGGEPVRGERGGGVGGGGEAGEGALRGGGGVMEGAEGAGLGAGRCRRRHGVGRSDGLRAARRLHPQSGLQVGDDKVVTFSL